MPPSPLPSHLIQAFRAGGGPSTSSPPPFALPGSLLRPPSMLTWQGFPGWARKQPDPGLWAGFSVLDSKHRELWVPALPRWGDFSSTWGRASLALRYDAPFWEGGLEFAPCGGQPGVAYRSRGDCRPTHSLGQCYEGGGEWAAGAGPGELVKGRGPLAPKWGGRVGHSTFVKAASRGEGAGASDSVLLSVPVGLSLTKLHM